MNRFFASLAFILICYFIYGFYVSQFELNFVPKKVKTSDFYYDYRLNMNIHTNQSIGSEPLSVIINESKKAQNNFILITDLNPQNVSLFALPTQFNHQESFELATKLAKNLNINLKTISIQSMFEFIKNILDAEFAVTEFSLMHENLQSRLRGLILMAYSNFSGSMLLTTGNKSEYATGYATLYGDMCGGLAPLGDLTKKQIVALSNLYNEETELIPKRIITRPPSAELKPNQKDQDSLPEYDDLDASVIRLVEKKLPVKGKTDEWLSKVLMRTEFKRWQAAPILKVSEHSFGRGRRYPIAHKANKI